VGKVYFYSHPPSLSPPFPKGRGEICVEYSPPPSGRGKCRREREK